jgi:hypothetical protein
MEVFVEFGQNVEDRSLGVQVERGDVEAIR